MSNVERYRELMKLSTLMNDPEWCKTIDQLKNYVTDDSKHATITYKKENQRKNHSFSFDSILYVPDTDSFIFTSYKTDFFSGKKTNEINDKLVLLRSDIVSFSVRDKSKPSDYIF